MEAKRENMQNRSVRKIGNQNFGTENDAGSEYSKRESHSYINSRVIMPGELTSLSETTSTYINSVTAGWRCKRLLIRRIKNPNLQ
eukprot:snap_masked-scaffold_23-processed-gene-0.13-mRNA-1 protein AED:1.00 eAED:1.00 QI:0/-1/0/0/-1/1/1/0/84